MTAWRGAQVVFAPYDASGVGIVSLAQGSTEVSSVSDVQFSFVEIEASGLVPGKAKYRGCAYTSAGVVLAPYNASSLAHFDVGTRTLTLIALDSTLASIPGKFSGVAMSTRGDAIFAPAGENTAVAIYDPQITQADKDSPPTFSPQLSTLSSFDLAPDIAIANTGHTHVFDGVCVGPGGRLVFPRDRPL